jgi:semaphorin 6
MPQPPKLHSPKGTMRKPPPTPAETLFQFPEGYGYRGPSARADNFGTLRSHQGDNAYRRNDGFATTRSVKKVYL